MSNSKVNKVGTKKSLNKSTKKKSSVKDVVVKKPIKNKVSSTGKRKEENIKNAKKEKVSSEVLLKNSSNLNSKKKSVSKNIVKDKEESKNTKQDKIDDKVLLNEINKDKNNKKKSVSKNLVKEKEESKSTKQDKIDDELLLNELGKDKKFIKKYKLNKYKCVRFLLIVILLGVFIYSVSTLVMSQIDYYRNKRDSQKLIDEVVLPNDSADNIGESDDDDSSSLERPEVNPLSVKIDFNKLRNTNRDIKAWMMFNRMYVNNPVVQSKDNEYYLNRSFYGKSSELGTIFMDYRNKSFDDKNVVLFGHSTIDKSMFGSLSDVFKNDFFDRENADKIYFYDVNNNLIQYQIFSYYTIDSEEYYIQTYFSSDSKFQEWLDTIKSRSFSNRGIEVTTSDKILTLSTCAGSRGTTKRRVIHAKRIQ